MKKIKNLLKILILLLTLFFYNTTFAETVPVKWFVNDLNPKVGEPIIVDVFIYPDVNDPIYTFSQTLMYNPDVLEFVDTKYFDNWFEVVARPHYLNDFRNGMLRRTAGYANGAVGETKFATFIFKAKKVGPTALNISQGFALNRDSVSYDIQNKNLNLNILDTDENNQDSSLISTTTDNLSKDQSFVIGGGNVIYEGDPYEFSIMNKNSNSITVMSLSIKVTDVNNNVVYNQATTSDFINKSFSIPNNFLKNGNYNISLNIFTKDDTLPFTTNKDFTVLKKPQQTFLDKYGMQFIIYQSTISFIILSILLLWVIHRLNKNRLKNKLK